VLTNFAEFRGHSKLDGASSFLVQVPDGRILAATALHLLGRNGGVEPTVRPSQLDAVLISWKLFPRTKPETAASVAGLAYPLPLRANLDWLLLSVESEPRKLPSLPLKMRPTPVSVGEEVYLVGVPYSEPLRTQNVYRCQVTGRGQGIRFRYNIDPPVDLRGFSGAPILDKQGLVVGLMTVWFEPRMNGEKYLEGGGEDSASALDQLSKKP
jgi:hypothetical protein